nr:PREDICTED: uncharacterized protein LOC100568089 [Anolis carolinensis]|eukprot:XP_008101746.1 PREDICTED: uncharacterized protein LOC100568089 [Anolis carolinensis]
MDNGMYWGSINEGRVSCIEGVTQKIEACKFHVICLPSGKIMIKNWMGLYLAAMDVPSEVLFPIQPVTFTDNENEEYDVFYKHNKVTFKAFNGLFLGRRCNKRNTLTATRFYPDETCYFYPVIGDIHPPVMEILGVVPCDISGVSCTPYIMGEQTFTNWSEDPVKHTFTMIWETCSFDRIIWTRLWGLGVMCACNFKILDTKANVLYSQNNEQVVNVLRFIAEHLTQEVEVPPRTEARGQFCVDKQNFAALGFTAIVRKTRPDESFTFHIVGGSWKGLVYNKLRLEVTHTPI